MKRLIFSFLLILALCGQGWAATVYTKTIGGTVYYESGAASCDAVTAADTAGDVDAAIAAAGAGGTCYICAGDYSGTEIDAADGIDITAANITVVGVGAVTLDGTGGSDHVYRVNVANTTSNIIVANSPTNKSNYYLDGTGNCTLSGCTSSGGFDGVSVYKASEAVTLNKCVVDGASNYGLKITGPVAGAGTTTTNYSIISDNLFGVYCDDVFTTATFNNCFFLRNTRYAIYAADGDYNVVSNNHISAANVYTLGAYNVVRGQSAGTGTTVLNNCLTLGPPTAPTSKYTNTTDNSPITSGSPQFVSNSKVGIVVCVIDDYYEQWYDVCDLADQYGIPVTLACSTIAHTPDWAEVQTRIDKGHGISSHSRRHIGLEDLKAADIRYVGAGSACTMTIAANHLTTTVTGAAGEDLDLDLTSTTYNNNTKLDTYIDGLAAYTYEGVSTRMNALSVDLAAVAGQDIKTAAYAMQFDETAIYTEEVDGAKSDIESNLTGVTCDTYMPPSNETGATLQAYLLANGYKGARGLTTWATGSYDMSSLSMFNIVARQMNLASEIGTTTNSIVGNVTNWAEWLCEFGGIVVIYSHANNEYTLANWAKVFEALQKSNVKTMTFSDALAYVQANGATADLGVTYTRTFTDGSDYRLTRRSPCVNAGTTITGVTTDYRSRPVPLNGKYDLGLYESKKGIIPLGGGMFLFPFKP